MLAFLKMKNVFEPLLYLCVLLLDKPGTFKGYFAVLSSCLVACDGITTFYFFT